MGTENRNPNNNIVCPKPADMKALIFEYSSMDIVKGPSTLLGIDLSSFFIPLKKYHYDDLKLCAGETITIDSSNAGDEGEVSFIGIIVTYPEFDAGRERIETGAKYIQYTFPIGGSTHNIGKIMLLSGSNQPGYGWQLDASPGGLTLTNPHLDFDVEVQVLIFT